MCPKHDIKLLESFSLRQWVAHSMSWVWHKTAHLFTMEIILLSFITALGYLIVTCKVLSIQGVVKYQVVLDIALTLGLPCLFIGTFSGLATAFIAGVFFSLMTAFLSLLTPKAKKEERKASELITLWTFMVRKIVTTMVACIVPILLDATCTGLERWLRHKRNQRQELYDNRNSRYPRIWG